MGKGGVTLEDGTRKGTRKGWAGKDREGMGKGQEEKKLESWRINFIT